jgi:aminoglycoside phosphotransferase family enzyme
VSDQAVPFEAKIAALRQTETYPEAPEAVEAIETHMSWVFLAGGHAYKLKKPVRYDGLDFSTLATRRFYLSEELRLNRRLAADVYLDLVALRHDALGALRIGDTGIVVEWLVKMRQLPADLMLDQLLAHGTVRPDLMAPVAAQLAAFYAGLQPAISDVPRYLGRLRREIDECESRLRDPEVVDYIQDARPLCDQLRAFLGQRPELFAARVRAGRIVEGHGDLRPEHVCMEKPPAIIDCLEFSVQLRTLDVADELGFLALECERLHAPQVGRALLDSYGALSGDRPEAALVDWYQAFRACVRAGLAIWHLKEARYRDSPRWALRARHYLRLAGEHLQRCVSRA